MTATATPARTWTTIGAEYTGPDDRARVETEIAGLDWTPVPDTLPMCPGLGVQEVIKQLQIPKVSLIAINGYLRYPDPPESAHYAVYGIEGNYKNGRARVYVLDTGTRLVPLASDFWPVEEEHA